MQELISDEGKVEILVAEARSLVRYRPVAVAIIVNKKGEILFVRSAKNPHAWYFPRGGIEVGESAQEGLFREMREELCLRRESLRFVRYLGTDDLDAGPGQGSNHGFTRGKRYFFFLMVYRGPRKKIKVDQREIVGYRWVKEKDIPEILASTREGNKKLAEKYLGLVKFERRIHK